MTGEQVRYGLENLNIDAKRSKRSALTGVMKPIATNCRDHEGARAARIQQWDGTKWVFVFDFYESDNQIIKPMIKNAAEKYVTEKKLTMRSCASELADADKAMAGKTPAPAAVVPAKK